MTIANNGTAMTLGERPEAAGAPFWHVLVRKDVLAGALFMAVAVLGLWISRDYPIGTAFRMGTGYVPRLLCWILLGLGAVVLVQGLRLALLGVGVGLGLALGATRLINSLLFGTSPTDVATFAGVATLLIVVAIAASLGPALRASRVDPLVALRDE